MCALMSDTPDTNKPYPRYAWQLVWLYVPILILLSPFTMHRSSKPVVLGYSWHYALLLVFFAIVGLGLSVLLLRLVRNTRPHRRLAFAYILLSGLVMFVVTTEMVWGFVEGDAFSGYRKWGQQRSPFVGFENIPDYTQQTPQGHVTFDEHGFRKHLTPRVSEEKEQLVVVMGGSSAFGFGLDDADTWPVELERRLRNQYGDHITVLNAANRGHNSVQQLIRLYMRVLPLKPSVVIYYGAWNDLGSGGRPMHMPWLSSTLAQASTSRHYLRLRNKGSGLYWENSFILERLCQAARTIWPHVTASREEAALAPHAQTSNSFEATSQLFIRNVDTMNMLCQRDGVLFMPVRYVADDENLKPRDREGLGILNVALRRYCQRAHVDLIDFEDVFINVVDRSLLFQADHYHPTAQGAKLIGAHVAEGVGAALFPQSKTLASVR